MKKIFTLAATVLITASIAQSAVAQGQGGQLLPGITGGTVAGGTIAATTSGSYETQIQAALNDGNTQLAADIAAEAIAANPDNANQIINFFVAANPAAAPQLMASIQSKAPNQASSALVTIANNLPDNAEGNTILAQVASNAAPAAGGNNANPNPFANIPASVLSRIQQNTGNANQNSNTPNFTENPGQTQTSPN